MSLIIRSAHLDDLPVFDEIQSVCYSSAILESKQSFRAKLKSNPEYCFIAEHEGKPKAYLVCLAVNDETFPSLNAPDIQRPEQATIFYLHDLAVLPTARGLTLGDILVRTALTKAQTQFKQSLLISIQGSIDFWARYGYKPIHPVPNALLKKVMSFGTEAILMKKVFT